MAINLALKARVDLTRGEDDWGRSWYGWDPFKTDQELWNQNRGTWRISRQRLKNERFVSLSYDGTIRVVAEVTGYDDVGNLVAVQGDVLVPGDPVRDQLIGGMVPRQRNPVSYVETQELDDMGTSERHAAKTPATAAFLLTNNPDLFPLDPVEHSRQVQTTASGRAVKGQWSVGSRKEGIAPGDRVFLLLQGRGPRGIIGSGFVTSFVFQGPHWDDGRRDQLGNYVQVEWDRLIEDDDPLPTELLKAECPAQHWAPQGSGTGIHADVLPKLEALWAEHLGLPTPPAGGSSAPQVQRWSMDPLRRKKVEDAAQGRLMKHYRDEGWRVRDTHIGHPYDAVATKDGQLVYLEAKGTETTGAGVLVTRGEVEHARQNPGSCVLGILSNIRFLPGGDVDPESGDFALHDWNPDVGGLQPQGFVWTPDGSRTRPKA